MMPTMKVQYLLKQWNDSGYELVITRNAYWQTRYIEPETAENSVSFMEYDYPVQSLGDQALQNNQLKRKAGILFALIYLLELIGLQPADFEPETV